METFSPRRLRPALAAGAACALMLLASGCSSDSSGTSSAPEASASASSAASSPTSSGAASSSPSASASTSAAPTSASPTAASTPTVDDETTESASPHPTGTVNTLPATLSPSSAAASPSASASAGSSSSAAADGSGACSTKDLHVSLSTDQGAAGSVYYLLGFSNHGQSTCTLSGFPAVSMVDGSGKTIGAVAAQASELPGSPATLSPGQSTQAVLRVTQPDLYGDQCHKTAASGIKVSAPGSSDSLTIHYTLSGCANSDVSNLSVSQIGAQR